MSLFWWRMCYNIICCQCFTGLNVIVTKKKKSCLNLIFFPHFHTLNLVFVLKNFSSSGIVFHQVSHMKKKFFPENKQKNSKKKKHSHDIFFHSLSLMKKKIFRVIIFSLMEKKMKSIQNFFFYQFLSRQHRRENYLENRSLGKKEASVLIIWKS